MTIVACVRTGDKYSVDYVIRLRDAVRRHFRRPHRFVCLTDAPSQLSAADILALDISSLGLPGWWGKMVLFSAEWRYGEPVVYFDLDTVIVGDVSTLEDVAVQHDFGICENFTRAAGHWSWPCRYGSCCMTFSPRFDPTGTLWRQFFFSRNESMKVYERFGDQMFIEYFFFQNKSERLPSLLQPLLPAHFFLGYRDLPRFTDAPPPGCSVVVFAGKNKPDKCQVPWVRKEWDRYV